MQLFKWDMEKNKIHMKTLTFDGEQVQSFDRRGGRLAAASGAVVTQEAKRIMRRSCTAKWAS